MARVFQTKRTLLQSLEEFPRAWLLLMEHIEGSALNKNSEVSLAALKAFQDVLSPTKQSGPSEDSSSDDFVWNVAWKTWVSVGIAATKPVQGQILHLPSQAFLTALVLIFPGLFSHIKSRYLIHLNVPPIKYYNKFF